MNRSTLSCAKRWVRADQRLVREPLSIGVLSRCNEPLGIVALASVEPKHLLVNVGVKMERARSDIRSVERSLEARPEVFDGVGMDAAFAISHGVVNKAVRVIRKVAVRKQSVRVDRGAREHACADVGHKFRTLAALDDHRLDATLASPVTLGHAEHDGFAFGRPVLQLAETETRNHRSLCLAADERFVRFNFSVEHSVIRWGHRFADAVKHEPRGFLRDTEGATKFVRGRSVLRVGEQPDCREPLGERDMRGLVDRADLGRTLPLALSAAPGATRLNCLNICRPAAHLWAGNSVRPAEPNGVFVSPVGVGKIDNRFLQSSGRFHTLNLPKQGAKCMAHPFKNPNKIRIFSI
jgi:hypothetical protein